MDEVRVDLGSYRDSRTGHERRHSMPLEQNRNNCSATACWRRYCPTSSSKLIPPMRLVGSDGRRGGGAVDRRRVGQVLPHQRSSLRARAASDRQLAGATMEAVRPRHPPPQADLPNGGEESEAVVWRPRVHFPFALPPRPDRMASASPLGDDPLSTIRGCSGLSFRPQLVTEAGRVRGSDRRAAVTRSAPVDARNSRCEIRAPSMPNPEGRAARRRHQDGAEG